MTQAEGPASQAGAAAPARMLPASQAGAAAPARMFPASLAGAAAPARTVGAAGHLNLMTRAAGKLGG